MENRYNIENITEDKENNVDHQPRLIIKRKLEFNNSMQKKRLFGDLLHNNTIHNHNNDEFSQSVRPIIGDNAFQSTTTTPLRSNTENSADLNNISTHNYIEICPINTVNNAPNSNVNNNFANTVNGNIFNDVNNNLFNNINNNLFNNINNNLFNNINSNRTGHHERKNNIFGKINGNTAKTNHHKQNSPNYVIVDNRIRTRSIICTDNYNIKFQVPRTDKSSFRIDLSFKENENDIYHDTNKELSKVYRNEYFTYLRNIEANYIIKTNYISTVQTNINIRIRSKMIDWMIDLHNKLGLQSETLYLATNYIDRFLQLKEVHRNKLQLVCVACLLIATKYEELLFPNINDIILLSNNESINRIDLLKMETTVINALKFELTVPTIHKFIDKYIKDLHFDEVTTNICLYFSERVMIEYNLMKYVPSQLAASIVYLSQRFSSTKIDFENNYEDVFGYKESQLIYLSNLIEIAIREGKPFYRSVFTKYSRSVRNKVSYIIHDYIGDTSNYLDCAEKKRNPI